jgi:hypothetical protein
LRRKAFTFKEFLMSNWKAPLSEAEFKAHLEWVPFDPDAEMTPEEWDAWENRQDALRLAIARSQEF